MKALTQPKKVRRSTRCDGPEENFVDQEFEVEASDVNHQWPHYGGHNHNWYQFTKADVGRRLMLTKQGNHYQCWNFIS